MPHIQPMADHEFDPANLDPGIRETVVYLRGNGFDTCDSGDGVTKDKEDRAFDVPHVVCRLPVHEMVFIFEANRLLITLGVNWTVEASYSANDETAVLIATRRE
jgi:hypothetical protein